MSQATNKPDTKPDPATTYERAKPQEQSPSGKLSQPAPPSADQHDHHQKQDADPSQSPRVTKESDKTEK